MSGGECATVDPRGELQEKETSDPSCVGEHSRPRRLNNTELRAFSGYFLSRFFFPALVLIAHIFVFVRMFDLVTFRSVWPAMAVMVRTALSCQTGVRPTGPGGREPASLPAPRVPRMCPRVLAAAGPWQQLSPPCLASVFGRTRPESAGSHGNDSRCDNSSVAWSPETR